MIDIVVLVVDGVFVVVVVVNIHTDHIWRSERDTWMRDLTGRLHLTERFDWEL